MILGVTLAVFFARRLRVMKIRSNGKVYRSESEWREIFVRYAGSGLSQECFCSQEGLALSTFNKWQKRLDESRAGAELPQFLELKPELSPRDKLSVNSVEFLFPSGLQVRIGG